ncbi:hypothetical protein HK102_004295, partial [Quaeritorhiza haematococci]
VDELEKSEGAVLLPNIDADFHEEVIDVVAIAVGAVGGDAHIMLEVTEDVAREQGIVEGVVGDDSGVVLSEIQLQTIAELEEEEQGMSEACGVVAVQASAADLYEVPTTVESETPTPQVTQVDNINAAAMLEMEVVCTTSAVEEQTPEALEKNLDEAGKVVEPIANDVVVREKVPCTTCDAAVVDDQKEVTTTDVPHAELEKSKFEVVDVVVDGEEGEEGEEVAKACAPFKAVFDDMLVAPRAVEDTPSGDDMEVEVDVSGSDKEIVEGNENGTMIEKKDKDEFFDIVVGGRTDGEEEAVVASKVDTLQVKECGMVEGIVGEGKFGTSSEARHQEAVVPSNRQLATIEEAEEEEEEEAADAVPIVVASVGTAADEEEMKSEDAGMVNDVAVIDEGDVTGNNGATKRAPADEEEMKLEVEVMCHDETKIYGAALLQTGEGKNELTVQDDAKKENVVVGTHDCSDSAVVPSPVPEEQDAAGTSVESTCSVSPAVPAISPAFRAEEKTAIADETVETEELGISVVGMPINATPIATSDSGVSSQSDAATLVEDFAVAVVEEDQVLTANGATTRDGLAHKEEQKADEESAALQVRSTPAVSISASEGATTDEAQDAAGPIVNSNPSPVLPQVEQEVDFTSLDLASIWALIDCPTTSFATLQKIERALSARTWVMGDGNVPRLNKVFFCGDLDVRRVLMESVDLGFRKYKREGAWAGESDQYWVSMSLISTRSIAAPHKSVVVRYTTDGWKTFREAPADLEKTTPSAHVDRYVCQIDLDEVFEDAVVGTRFNLEFAVRHETQWGEVAWDNKGGENFKVGFMVKTM